MQVAALEAVIWQAGRSCRAADCHSRHPSHPAYPRLYAAWPGLPCFNFQGQVPNSSNYSQLELSKWTIPLLIWLPT